MSQIKVGDLVMLMRNHCDETHTGHIYTATKPYAGKQICHRCNTVHISDDSFWLDGKWVAPRSWLKRIPPLSELESEKNKEELTA